MRRRCAIFAFVAAVAAGASIAFAGGVGARLWDSYGCWIDRSPRQPPPRRDREQLGAALPVRGKNPAGYVAFTFDDGPSEHTTLDVLDTLDRFDVPATFFVVGWRLQGGRRGAKQRREILKETVRRGYLIGNHTFKHRKLDTLGAKRQRSEIDKTHDAIQNVLGFRPYLFRPPYARMGGAARRYLAKRGYTTVRWNLDPEDFLIEDPERLRSRVLSLIKTRGGGVVLLHDTRAWTAEALPLILADLETENCRRLNAGETLIVPVSLHYFIRNSDSTPRPIPDAVGERTEQYRRALRARCKSLIDKDEATN